MIGASFEARTAPKLIRYNFLLLGDAPPSRTGNNASKIVSPRGSSGPAKHRVGGNLGLCP